MRIGDIPGGVDDVPGYNGWSRIDSFQWQVALPAPSDSGSTRGDAAVVADPMFLMPLDVSYVPMLDAILQGRVFTTAEVVQLNDELLPTLEFEYSAVLLSNVEILIGSAGPIVQGSLRPEELVVRQIEYENGRPSFELETSFDIEGGTAATTASRLVPLNGDYNLDGVVDGGDYETWLGAYGHGPFAATADGNGNGYVDAADYTVWRDHAGSLGLVGVPEPNTMTSLVGAVVTAAASRRRSTSAG